MRFLIGFMSGVFSTVIVLFLIYVSHRPDTSALRADDTTPGLIIFPEKGECITRQNLEIFQTIKPNMALAHFDEFPNETLVLLINYDGKAYYDNQNIQIPVNMCARQIGTYQYQTKMEFQKTVPVVLIEKCNFDCR